MDLVLAAPAVASPQSYTPRHVAEKIVAQRDGLAGERKRITVLFANLAGFTELIQGFDPEDAQRLLDGAVQRMMDAAHRYEGTVIRPHGDGLMAPFDASIHFEPSQSSRTRQRSPARGSAPRAARTPGAS